MDTTYTQNLKQGLVNHVWFELDSATDRILQSKTKEEFHKQLTEISQTYGCHSLGFNLIRILHRTPDEKKAETVQIGGFSFSNENIVRPDAASDSDWENYARLLARKVSQNGKFDMPSAEACFAAILKENVYLDCNGKRPIKRKDILNIARGLGLDLQKTKELLYKTIPNSAAFSSFSASDLIEQFIIQNNQTVAEREQLLADYRADKRSGKSVPLARRKRNATDYILSKVEKLLQANSNYEQSRSDFLETLLEEAGYLDVPNRTAKTIYEKLTLFIQNASSYGCFDKSIDVIDQLEELLIKEDTSVNLSDSQRIDLIRDILSTDASDTFAGSYMNWVIPVIEDGSIVKTELGRRLEAIILGKKVEIQKYDLLFALFLACALVWEYDESADIVTLEDRLSDFINLSNKVLDKALIEDRFYLPHPLETSIAIAIMHGDQGEAVYLDVMDSLSVEEAMPKIRTNSELDGKGVPVFTGEAPDLPDLSTEDAQKFKKLDDKLANKRHPLCRGIEPEKIILKETAKGTEQLKKKILWEVEGVAAAIRDVWQAENFRSIDVHFSQDGQFGYIPCASIGGEEYRTIGSTPLLMQRVLFGDDKLDIVFFDKDKSTKQEGYISLQNYIDLKCPNLDPARTTFLHRKALLYMLLGQLEIYCGWDAHIKYVDGREVYLLDFQCEAFVERKRMLKIKGFDMATLSVTDKT